MATPTEPNGNKPVTARNQALLSSSATNFTLTSDSAGPTGGALTVNGTVATGGGSASYDSDGSVTIGLRTDYNADGGSGVNTSTLTREDGTLNADICSAYGAPTTLVGTPAQSGLATGCYRYTLTGTDNVGNASTITTVVKVDLTDPTAPSLVLADTSADVHTTGTTAFYRPAGSGSFDVTASSTDGQSGIASYTFPTLTGFTLSGTGGARTYTLATPTEPDGAKTVTTTNNAGRTNNSTFTLTADTTAPAGGALTVNGGVASGGGSQSYDNDGTFTIGLRTDYTDALSGIATSTLTREDGTLSADACSAYGAPSTLVGSPAQNGLATGCYRYTLTGTDQVGNVVSIATVVKVDTSAPAAPGLALADSSADVHTTGTTAFYRPAGSGCLRRHRQLERRPVRDPRLPLPHAHRLHDLRLRCDAHVHARDADGAERCQDGQRAQQRPADRRLELHAHLRRDGPDRWRPDRQRSGGQRWRLAELRRRRQLPDRRQDELQRRRTLRLRHLRAHP